MKKGITFGGFNPIHEGHIRLLKRAKEQCDYLVVCVDDYDYLLNNKGQVQMFSTEERIEDLKGIKYVDEVDIQSLSFGKKEAIEKHKPDVIFVGDDWNKDTFSGEGLGVEVVYLPRTSNISGSQIRGYGKFNYSFFSEEEKKRELNRIKKIEEILYDYDVYLQFGTLLGCIREQGLIPHDNDVDICYMSKYHTAKEVEQEMIDIYNRFDQLGMLNRYFTREKTTDWWAIGYKPIQNPFGQVHILVDGHDIDLFTSWIDENKNYYTCQWGCFGKKINFFPCIKKEMMGIEFKVPQNYESILQDLYGNWREPKSEKPHRERKSYLDLWLKGEL